MDRSSRITTSSLCVSGHPKIPPEDSMEKQIVLRLECIWGTFLKSAVLVQRPRQSVLPLDAFAHSGRWLSSSMIMSMFLFRFSLVTFLPPRRGMIKLFHVFNACSTFTSICLLLCVALKIQKRLGHPSFSPNPYLWLRVLYKHSEAKTQQCD